MTDRTGQQLLRLLDPAIQLQPRRKLVLGKMFKAH